MCFFLHRSINYPIVLLPLEFEHIEAVCVDLHCNSTKQRVICSFAPEGIDLYYLTCLTKFLKIMCGIDYTSSVCGNFNLSEYDWSACCNPSSMPAPEVLFANYVIKSGLTLLVSELTISNNILDLLLVNDTQEVFHATVTAPFKTSDHNAIH